MVSEMKVGNSFPVSQFLVDVYGPPITLEHDIYGADLMLFIREDIPCKLLYL